VDVLFEKESGHVTLFHNQANWVTKEIVNWIANLE
jgi:hypothetical protein